MALTQFPSTPLPPVASATVDDAGGGAAPSVELDFRVAKQLHDQWCWAAVSTSVSLFYAAGSTWTQCKVATQELNLACCAATLPGGCDHWWYLNRALTRTGNLNQFLEGDMDEDSLRGELANGAPVGIRIEWPDQSGHFVAIAGLQPGDGESTLTITDPIYGTSVQPVSAMAGSYIAGGRWTHTYTTTA